MDFKNSIKIGIELESSKDIEGKLKTVIEQLSNNKIKLSADDNVTKQLENLTKMLNNFKSKMGENISLGNIDKAINSATLAMVSLNEQVLKTSKVNIGDGITKQLKQTSEGIGVVKKELELLDKNNNNTSKIAPTTITDYNKIKQAIEDVTKAQKQLNALESNGFSDVNKIADLKNIFSSLSNFGSDNELKGYLNQVKELLATESKVIEYSNKLTSLKSSMANLTDQKYSNVLNTGSFEQIVNEINKAQNELKSFDNVNLNGLKQQFTELNNVVSKFSAETINAQKSEQENIQQTQKTTELLQKQAEAYQRLNTLKDNKIINSSEINNLEKLTKSASSLKEINSILSSIGKTESRESSISTLTKQITEAQTKLEKMKTSFGSKLPSGFIESTEKELNKLSSELKKVDGVNFTGIKNGLSSVKSSMEQTNSETKQLVSSLKETNNSGFFSNMSNFLGKIGVFYGVQQVVQEISQQFKNAGEYVLTLDKNISNIQMITGKTKEQVVAITNSFKEMGAELHTTNTEIMSGAEELMRAGYSDEDSKKLLESATIGSKISGQTTDEVSQQLITLKNSFNMSADSMSHVIDIFSKMDNTSATSLDFDDLVV